MSLKFSLSSVLLLSLYSLSFIGDLVFPVVIFISLFWLLSYLISIQEFLAWQNAGVSPKKILIFLFKIVFYISFCFFFLSDILQAYSISAQKEVFKDWQSSLLEKMNQDDFYLKMGDFELFNIKHKDFFNFYLLYPLKEYQRSFFILEGEASSLGEGITIQNSSFFSPALTDEESYYQGQIDSLSLNMENFFDSLDNTFSAYFLPFSQLSYNYLFKESLLKKEHSFLWHQKITNLLSTWVLALLAILFSFKKAKEDQSTYPFWVGFLFSLSYIFLVLLMRVLFFYFWESHLFFILWIPLFILIGLLPFSYFKGSF